MMSRVKCIIKPFKIILFLISLTPFTAISSQFNSGECRQKMSEVRQYAFNGSPKAQLILGLAYLYGHCIEQDDEQAAKFIKKAARKKIPLAMMYLSNFYSKGIGVSQDTERAKSLLRKTSDMNHAPAMFQLAMSTFNIETTKEESEAVSLLKKSAKMDYKPAMYLLAKMHDSGTVIPQDLNSALILYEKLSTSDYKDSAQLFNDRKQYSDTFEEQEYIEVITVVGAKWDVDMLLDSVLMDSKSINSSFDRHPATGSHIRGTTCGLQGSRGCKVLDQDTLKSGHIGLIRSNK